MSKKIAVDKAAEEYWKSYWGAYGESLVKDVPRKIKAELSKTASVAEIIPSGHVQLTDGSFEIEGALRGEDGTCRLFAANVDAQGNVINARVYGASK